MQLKHFIIALGLVTASTAVLADNSGFYIGGKIGASILQSKDVKSNGYSYSNADYDYSITDNKNKTVFNLGLNVGYDFNAQYAVSVRAELDYTYRSSAKISSSSYFFSSIGGTSGGDTYEERFKIKQSTLMLNGYYDFHNSSDFTPYLGLGVGMGFVKYKGEENDSSTISKTKFTWSAMAGVSYQLSKNLSANVEYRYLNSGKIEDTDSDGIWHDNFSAKLQSHDLNIGLRYAF